MPARNGYPYKTLYHQARKLMGNAKYEFIREGHTYFGKHFETEVFGLKMHAYVYVDKDKNWCLVRFGFFILLSTEMKEPDAKLDDYLEFPPEISNNKQVRNRCVSREGT
jgi:hypothetical protein